MLIAAGPGEKHPDGDAEDETDDEAKTGEFIPRPKIGDDGIVEDDPADNEKTNRVGITNRPS